MMEQVRFGILGCGVVANYHAQAIADTEGAELVCACGRTPESTERFCKAQGIRPMGSYEEMLASPEVDAVCICTPSGLHAEEAIAALTAGKHLVIEKPVSIENAYGNFFFYSQHLAQVMTEIFGCYPNSVKMYPNGNVYTGVVRYDDYDVSLTYVDGSGYYYAGISCQDSFVGGDYGAADLFTREFMNYYNLLKGEPQQVSYEDFFAPVYVLNAMNRSIETGEEAVVNKFA